MDRNNNNHKHVYLYVNIHIHNHPLSHNHNSDHGHRHKYDNVSVHNHKVTYDHNPDYIHIHINPDYDTNMDFNHKQCEDKFDNLHTPDAWKHDNQNCDVYHKYRVLHDLDMDSAIQHNQN